MKKINNKKKKGIGLWILWIIPFLFVFAILFGLSSSSKEYKNYINKEKENGI